MVWAKSMRRNLGSGLLLVALSAWLGSGCSRTTLRCQQSQPLPMPLALLTGFDYPKQTNPATRIKVLESKSDFTVKRVELLAAPNGAETNRWIELDYYDPSGKTHVPAILVLPILGGGYQLERYFA